MYGGNFGIYLKDGGRAGGEETSSECLKGHKRSLPTIKSGQSGVEEVPSLIEERRVTRGISFFSFHSDGPLNASVRPCSAPCPPFFMRSFPSITMTNGCHACTAHRSLSPPHVCQAPYPIASPIFCPSSRP